MGSIYLWRVQPFPDIRRGNLALDWEIAPYAKDVLNGERSFAALNDEHYKLLKQVAEWLGDDNLSRLERVLAIQQLHRFERIAQSIFISRVGEQWFNRIDAAKVRDVKVPLRKIEEIRNDSGLNFEHIALAAQIAWSFELASDLVMPELLEKQDFRDSAAFLAESTVLIPELRFLQPPSGDFVVRTSTPEQTELLAKLMSASLVSAFQMGLTHAFGGLGVVHQLAQTSDPPLSRSQVSQLTASSSRYDRSLAGLDAERAHMALEATSTAGDSEKAERDFEAYERVDDRLSLKEGHPAAVRVERARQRGPLTPVHMPGCAAIYAQFAPDPNVPGVTLPFFREVGLLVRVAYEGAGLFDPDVRFDSKSSTLQALAFAKEIQRRGVDKVMDTLYSPVWHSGDKDAALLL